MGYARSKLVAKDGSGFFHCMSRCVRQSFLCGLHRESGQSFEHRRKWIEDRILLASKSYSVAICAYAVMSNHFHVVLEVDGQAPNSWSALEVAQRWLQVFPGPKQVMSNPSRRAKFIAEITEDSERIAELRSRLGSISWFMRSINEPIARMANQEENKKGRFWEGRFKCQALLDNKAVLSCMAYVDLNPIRAGKATSLSESNFTSISKRRIAYEKARPSEPLSTPLQPISSSLATGSFGLSAAQYIELVEWTAIKGYLPKSRSKDSEQIKNATPPWFIEKDPVLWLNQVRGTENLYFRAIGSLQSLRQKAAEMGQHWMRAPPFLKTHQLDAAG